MGQYNGYLFSKLHLIGSKSQGPTYFLQRLDARDSISNAIVEQIDEFEQRTELWKEDPNLELYLGKYVTVDGEFISGRLHYHNISINPRDGTGDFPHGRRSFEQDQLMGEYNGYLFSKLHLIGSRSQGPTYFLQRLDVRDSVSNAIIEQIDEFEQRTELWKEDPNLGMYLGKYVTVNGAFISGHLRYHKISINPGGDTGDFPRDHRDPHGEFPHGHR